MSDFRSYIEFTQAREGGLSRDPFDSAARYPVPDGSGYHTNKGITWTTFKRLSKVLDYNPTPELFYAMPDWLFDEIFEYYWKQAKADKVENQALANIIFQSLWGGGYRQLVKDIQRALGFAGKFVDGDLGKLTADALNRYENKRELYSRAHADRLKYLRSAKTYAKHGAGWERRMKKLFEFNLQYLTQ